MNEGKEELDELREAVRDFLAAKSAGKRGPRRHGHRL